MVEATRDIKEADNRLRMKKAASQEVSGTTQFKHAFMRSHFMRAGTVKKTLRSKKKKPKPKVTKEQLRAVIHNVFSEADDDGNGDLDINECRTFCKKLMTTTYPD